MMAHVGATLADITTLRVDAIVNAANETLLGGGGVDGAIHRAAGPALLEACRALPASASGVRCPAGEARITPGFGLPARYVIHTVGPVWRSGTAGEARLLACCYRNALRVLREHRLRTIAFPAISCGAYGYPLGQAVAIAVREVRAHVAGATTLREVVFACFGEGALAAYRRGLGKSVAGSS